MSFRVTYEGFPYKEWSMEVEQDHMVMSGR